MAAERNRKHIFVSRPPKAERYSSPGGGGGKKPPPPASRAAHAEVLKKALLDAEAAGKSRRAEAEPQVHGAEPGLYIEFDSLPGFELNHGSLTNVPHGIELVAVSEIDLSAGEAGATRLQRGTVFVPEGQLKHFFERLEKYALETPKKKGERRHEDLFDRIANLRLATLRALWTDSPNAYPADESSIWWEVWLRRQDDQELERLLEFASLVDIEVGDRRLAFDDRIVTLVYGSPQQLSLSIDVLGDLAEVRRAKVAAAFFVDQSPADQADWLRDLRDRSQPAPDDAPAVCVLDTGVTREHPLLEASLHSEDCHAVDPAWGAHDDGGGPAMQGHGTEMAGLALWGELWPETLRALLVHSAEWTQAMGAHLKAAKGKRAQERLIRRYGFGVPSLWRALRSADDALTLIVQSQIAPFASGTLHEMHLHELPWPAEALAALGKIMVRLRVTLSYFVEPNPGRRGWRKRHRYASHGLRFEVRGPTETTDEFRKRINKLAREEGDEWSSSGGDSSGWTLGKQARDRGSLHSDIWEGTAADLANRGIVGVFPVGGWWKEMPQRDRSADGARYGLIVSIETEATGGDLWTPVAAEVGIPAETVEVEI